MPAWYNSLTLTERVAALRARPRTNCSVEVNADRAAQRLLRWRSQTPFTSGLYFAQRLALDGISEDELLCLLGEPLAVNEGSFAPAPRWWVDIARACAH